MYNYIKRFKNGKVKLFVPKNDFYYRDLYGDVIEAFYFDEMELNNLYIVTIEGELFIVDFNTSRVYDFFGGYLIQNPLKYLLDVIAMNNKLYLHPLSKRESRQLLEQFYREQEEME